MSTGACPACHFVSNATMKVFPSGWCKQSWNCIRMPIANQLTPCSHINGIHLVVPVIIEVSHIIHRSFWYGNSILFIPVIAEVKCGASFGALTSETRQFVIMRTSSAVPIQSIVNTCNSVCRKHMASDIRVCISSKEASRADFHRTDNIIPTSDIVVNVVYCCGSHCELVTSQVITRVKGCTIFHARCKINWSWILCLDNLQKIIWFWSIWFLK